MRNTEDLRIYSMRKRSLARAQERQRDRYVDIPENKK